MGRELDRIGTPADLERCIEESAAGPVLVLKHSTT